MHKNSKFFTGLFSSTLLCLSANISADIYYENAFLYGDNIEVGIGSDGALGSDISSPDSTRKSYGKKIGFISDPEGNKFKGKYHGDFFLPGWPEEGWGVSFDGKTYNNNSNQQGAEIVGSLSNFKKTAKSQSVIWKGVTEGLEITQTYRVYSIGTAIIIDVTLKNTTTAEMKEVYYMRTIDPDNNAEQDPTSSASKYVTTNSIISQGSGDSGNSAVSAMQDAKSGLFTKSLLTLNAYGKNSRATYGGMSNRKPEDVYTGAGLLKQTGTNKSDEAISIAFKYNSLKPGQEVTFRTGYQLKDIPVATIDLDGNDNSGASGNEYKQLYILGSLPTKITDTDLVISGTGFTQLEQASITLTTPQAGDKLEVLGTLPAGITLNTADSSTSNLLLEGAASIADYQIALQQITFSNTDTLSSTATRIINIQVVDDNDTPSTSSQSTINVTTPIELNNPNIAVDNIVNKDEVNTLKLIGHSASKANIVIQFTDKDGKKLSPPVTTTADDNGDWNINPTDLSSLSDGLIKIVMTATDRNGNKSSLAKEIKKDTTIILTNITPLDKQVVSDATPVFKGKTDPKADVSLKVLPDGKEYITVADTNGAWEIPLDKFPMNVDKTVKITAKDPEGNVISVNQSFKTPNLPLIIDSPSDNAVISTSKPMVSGTSKPGTKISVITSSGESCNAITDDTNHWSCHLPTLTFDKDYKITVTTEDNDGNKATKEINVSTDKLPLAVISPQDNSITEDTTPTFTGTTAPNTAVTVTVASGQECKTTADIDGKWRCELPELPVGGPYDVTITADDKKGNKTTLKEKITIPKIPLTIKSPIDEEKITTTDTLVEGTSDPDTNIMVFGSDGERCDTVSDSKGLWSCQLVGLQLGKGKLITVASGDGENRKVKIRTVDIINSSEEVKTILTGGAGSSSPLMLLLFGLLGLARIRKAHK